MESFGNNEISKYESYWKYENEKILWMKERFLVSKRQFFVPIYYIRSKTNSSLVQNMKKKSPLDSKKYTKNLVGIWLHFIWRVLKMKHRTHCMVWKHLLLFNLFLYYNRIFYYKKWSISLANRIKKKHRTRKYSLVLNIYFKWCMLLCRNILQNFTSSRAVWQHFVMFIFMVLLYMEHEIWYFIFLVHVRFLKWSNSKDAFMFSGNFFGF